MRRSSMLGIFLALLLVVPITIGVYYSPFAERVRLQDQATIRLAQELRNSGVPPNVTRFVDTEASVVCYVGNAMSCLPLSQTTLKGR